MWPVIDDIERMSVVPQVNAMQAQSCITRDGVCVAVSGVIQYDVLDIRLALRAVQDVDAAINDLTSRLIVEAISTRTWDQCRDVSAVERDVEDSIQAVVEGWGLRILSFGFADFAQHRVFRLLGRFAPKYDMASALT
jgi:regulator of protease activity HflC (stomatin/prohibitin superfamily)